VRYVNESDIVVAGNVIAWIEDEVLDASDPVPYKANAERKKNVSHGENLCDE
jgi:hypothetical protein